MEARPCRIVEFFDGTKQMMVPLFQRTYEWGQPQWEALWDDLIERYQRSDEEPADVSHFVGAIVTVPARSVPVGVSKYLVIDGQQRLTTAAILLCAIRTRLEANSREARRIYRLLNNEDYDGDDVYKLLPTQPDRPAWRSLMEDPAGAIPSRFRAACQFFQSRLDAKIDDEETLDVRRLFEVVQSRLSVVFINLGENDDPYLIFESLNAKGSPLTQADLVRNYLLLRMRTQDQDRVYQQHWLPMQERLGDDLPEFVRQYLMQSGVEVPKGHVYSVLKARLSGLRDDAMPDRVEDLARASQFYLRITQPTHEEDASLKRGFARLRRWEISTANPLLLRLYAAYAEGRVTAEELGDCLIMIESFGVRRFICGVPTNQLKRIFLKLTSQVDGIIAPTGTAENLRERLASGIRGTRWPKDDEFHARWLDATIYANPIDRCRFILESLEEAHDHREAVDPRNVTIEHVMPQTLSEAWRDDLGSAAALHDRYVDTIGNLTLSAYNGELSNLAFSRKRELYANSHFELTRALAAEDRWDPEAITARAERLWALARSIWPRPA